VRFEGLTVWRLLVDPPKPADWNMAADEAALEALRLGISPPSLRLYRWERPTLSLGRAQTPNLHAERAKATGVVRVRRVTGGRLVLHASDFTYAVVLDHAPASVTASYRFIAAALESALNHLGVTGLQVRAPLTVPDKPRSLDCFGTTSQADLACQGSKLIGSAQLRRDRAVLQHGTLYRVSPLPLYGQVFEEGSVASVRSLDQVLHRAPDWDELVAAWVFGFENALGIRLEPGHWSDWELRRIEAVRASLALL
jgi:lipoate-protein ligase A